MIDNLAANLERLQAWWVFRTGKKNERDSFATINFQLVTGIIIIFLI